MVQEMDAVEDIEYDLVEDAEEEVITKAILTGGFKSDSKILNHFLQ